MAVLSNSIFFNVVPTALETVGWEVQVLSHTDYATVKAIIPRFSNLTIGPELSAAGTGSITLDLDDPLFKHPLSDGSLATDLLDFECVWSAYQDGNLRFQWFGEVVTEAVLQGDGTRTVTISGPGIGSVLSWPVVLPDGFPAQSIGSSDPTAPVNVPTQFPLEPLFQVFRSLVVQAQQRKTVTFLQLLFTDTGDSGGVAWADTNWTDYQQFFADQGTGRPVFIPEPGKNYLDLLTQIAGHDTSVMTTSPLFVDWYMWPGFKLDVRQTFGSHLSDTVVLHQQASALDIQRTRSRDAVRNLIVVQDDLGAYSVATDTDSIAAFSQRELMQRNTGVQTESALIRPQMASIILQQNQAETSSWTVSIDSGKDGRRPFFDFHVGDWVALEVAPGFKDEFRVLVIAVSIDVDGVETCQLTLQTKLAFQQQLLAKQMITLQNTVVNLPFPPLAPIDIPSVGTVVPVYDPTFGDWVPTDIGNIGSGSSGGGGTTGGGSGGNGVHVFIQSTDPAASAHVGDFWLKTV
jgi:hypothetical protein